MGKLNFTLDALSRLDRNKHQKTIVFFQKKNNPMVSLRGLPRADYKMKIRLSMDKVVCKDMV